MDGGMKGGLIMGRLPVYKNSFFCSPLREDGLKLTMVYENGNVLCDIIIDNRYEGYGDVAHGGMVIGILDTMMWYVILMETKKISMTRHLDMDFFKPVICNKKYRAKSMFLQIMERDIYASASIENESGELCARVTGLFREAKDLSVKTFLDRLDFSYSPPEMREHFMSILKQHKGRR